MGKLTLLAANNNRLTDLPPDIGKMKSLKNLVSEGHMSLSLRVCTMYMCKCTCTCMFSLNDYKKLYLSPTLLILFVLGCEL